MPSLDNCISDIYEPGNIPADSGLPPTELTFTIFRQPAAAQLTFSAAAPSVARTNNLIPAPANLVLSTTAPVVDVSIDRDLTPVAANLVLSTSAPDVNGPYVDNAGSIDGSTSSTALAPPLPSNRANGDLMLAWVHTTAGGKTFSVGGVWTIIDQNSDANISMALAAGIVDGSEAAPFFSWSGAAAVHGRTLLVKRNHATPIGNTTKATGSSTTLAVPAVTGLTAGSIVVAVLCTTGNQVIPVPNGYSSHAQYNDSFASDREVSEIPPGSSGDAISVTISNLDWAGMMVEVKKA